jgi:glycosyltransferase involved in cell wall biosynthesis
MDNHARILMVAYPFPPYMWIPGASIRLIKFIKYMAHQRPYWKIDVITAGYGPSEYTLPRNAEDLLAEVPKSVQVFRVNDPSCVMEKSTLLSMANNHVKQIISSLHRYVSIYDKRQHIIKENSTINTIPDQYMAWNDAVMYWLSEHTNQKEYDLIYVSSPPYSTTLLGVQIKKKLHLPLVVDIKDDWTVGPDFEQYPPERRMQERTMEQQMVQNADEVILVTPASLESYRQRYPTYQNFNLITNGVDLEDYKDILLEGQPPKFKITYAGSLGGHNRSPINFFKSFKRFLNESKADSNSCEVCFPSNMNPDFWTSVYEMGLEHWVKSIPSLPFDKFKQHLAESCVLLSINYYGRTTLVPGKLYEYWAIGRPILLIEKPGAATELVKKYDLGLTVDPDDIDGIYRALHTLYQDYIYGRIRQLNPEGLEQFSREQLTSRLCSIFERHL